MDGGEDKVEKAGKIMEHSVDIDLLMGEVPSLLSESNLPPY